MLHAGCCALAAVERVQAHRGCRRGTVVANVVEGMF